ncbi:hypothetical protein BDQ12DRAFT_118711 [Crucibulum laeve]|uniref:G-protein coupled receptors family 1 profile domain-containing protein n=1 Tax=Crucibulum laeve TaxID=68775 RepID=A0A5C3LG03_9AGAR|nr:hypothetical protein BDQ12DRAFT_118711 [Crucibulum laeve]
MSTASDNSITEKSTKTINPSQITAFNMLVIIATCMIGTVLTIAILSPSIHRRKTWYSLMAAFMVFATTGLPIIGHQLGPDPPFSLCLFQAALVYAIPPLAILSVACFIFDLRFMVLSLVHRKEFVGQKTELLLILLPWAVFFTIITEILVLVHMAGRSTIERSLTQFYCHVTLHTPLVVTTALSVVSWAITVPLEIWTAGVLYKNWTICRRMNVIDSQIYASTLIRSGVLTIGLAIGIGLTACAFNIERASWDMCFPLAPILVAIAFGTHKDMIRACMFWKRIKLRVEDKNSKKTSGRS